MTLGRTVFESTLSVRPDDLDLFRHVHSSKYLDYVLAARFDQMKRCYGMAMEEFLQRGLGWVVRTAHVEFKRPLGLGDSFIVRTWVDDLGLNTVKVQFEILKQENRKLAANGWCDYTLIRLDTGRAEKIPADIAAKYSI